MRNANKRQRFVTVLFVLGIAAAAAFAVFAGNGSAARSQVPSNTTPPTISGSAQEIGRAHV